MYSLLPALVSGLFLGYGLYVLSSRGLRRTRQASAKCWLTLQSLMKWFLGWQKNQVFPACSYRRSRIKP